MPWQNPQITEVHEPKYPDIPACGNLYYFYSHPIIQRIQNLEAWTLSGKTEKSQKVPLDAWEYKLSHRLVGAVTSASNCLMTLRHAYDTFLPDIAGLPRVPYVHKLDCCASHLVCLDVEPSCDEELKRRFLRMPFAYGEYSLSGKGFHLLFELPDEIFRKYPAAQKKLKMQHESGQYEILLNHYMTFTENMLYGAPDPLGMQEFHEVFEDLCRVQQHKEDVRHVTPELIPKEDIPYFDYVMWYLKKTRNNRDPDSYPSPSQYEFGTISVIANQLYYILHNRMSMLQGYTYSDQEIIMLIYYKLVDEIPYREKHDTYRNGLPYLIFRIQSLVQLMPSPYSPEYEAFRRERTKEWIRMQEEDTEDHEF